jgi:hypothetical protein
MAVPSRPPACLTDAAHLHRTTRRKDRSASAGAAGFLRRAVTHSAGYWITVERLITDNGNPYLSTVHAIACRALGIRHIRTQPYRPRTNGKACVLASRCRPAGWRRSPRLSV